MTKYINSNTKEALGLISQDLRLLLIRIKGYSIIYEACYSWGDKKAAIADHLFRAPTASSARCWYHVIPVKPQVLQPYANVKVFLYSKNFRKQLDLSKMFMYRKPAPLSRYMIFILMIRVKYLIGQLGLIFYSSFSPSFVSTTRMLLVVGVIRKRWSVRRFMTQRILSDESQSNHWRCFSKMLR